MRVLGKGSRPPTARPFPGDRPSLTSVLGATTHRGSCFEHHSIRLMRTWDPMTHEEVAHHVVRRHRLVQRPCAPCHGTHHFLKGPELEGNSGGHVTSTTVTVSREMGYTSLRCGGEVPPWQRAIRRQLT